MKNTFYVTTPIYYASGAPHIGHAFATLYADVIARYQRQLGREVYFLTGMDEHGSKIATKAAAAGQEPQHFVDALAKKYLSIWQKLNISYDGFIRTTSVEHKQAVVEFVSRLEAAGAIYEDEYEGLYCVGCEKFLTEKDLDAKGQCPDHKLTPEPVKETNLFFNLKKYLPAIKQLLESGELAVVPATRQHEVLRMIDDGIPDFSISREKVKWGIPWPGRPEQTIYVWADALSNYITALGYPDGALFKKYWPADVHIVGVEINKFHSIYWPAMLLAAGVKPAKKVFVHGLFTVNGEKMSKTVGNVIDPLAMIETYGVDATRYLLLSQFSAQRHGDIKQAEFANKYNDDLAKGVGNLFQRVNTMIKNYCQGGEVTAAPDDTVVAGQLALVADYHRYMTDLNLFEALKTVMALAGQLDKYVDDTKPWELAKQVAAKDRLETTLSTLNEGLAQIRMMLLPFMPTKMADEGVDLFPRLR